jgi:hypothetical protein
VNRPARAVPAEPSDNELRAVWLAMRRSTWPATFDEAMADALLSRLVRLAAKHPPPAVRKGFTTSAPAAPLQGTTARPHCLAPYLRRDPLAFDRKRAAAGDRDDD